ncbi:PepSY-like domain-containing protein [Chryseobacterium sp. JUb7]|uniref:PepSY-like domain-containing protein n=1 Tax=Chryseobacterium sp. JUb7 TaxID=2940599 RepID=UPI0021678028|nr:PepSY-like domain-containing protein [Chryseobacterium sp. JUb7]MCS3532361.1 hypothetical protein [Chryseobacterium sp. JUb7]
MVNWNLINGKGRKFSSKDIRKKILSHMTRNHQGNLVESIEKKYNAYKISLMNGLSLIFDADGRYVKTTS